MVEPLQFPSIQRGITGDLVKVCRHGECLWLKVKSVRPSGALIAVVDNHPIEWPENYGDPVEITADEIVTVWPQVKRVPHEGKVF